MRLTCSLLKRSVFWLRQSNLSAVSENPKLLCTSHGRSIAVTETGGRRTVLTAVWWLLLILIQPFLLTLAVFVVYNEGAT